MKAGDEIDATIDADGSRQRWRGTVVRVTEDLVEIAPIGCSVTIEAMVDQVVGVRAMTFSSRGAREACEQAQALRLGRMRTTR